MGDEQWGIFGDARRFVLAVFAGLIVGALIGWLMIGCSYTAMSGKQYSRSGLSDGSVESATAYSIVIGADTQQLATMKQLQMQRRAFDECVKHGYTNCYMIGFWGSYSYGGAIPGWWWPDTFQSDATYYRGVSR